MAGASKFKNGEPTNSVRLDFVHENDVQLGLLLDWLERTDDRRRPGKKLIENTLVIFSSDNGAESKAKTATGPYRANKGSTYEGGHRVPFMASWPIGGIRPGSQCARLLGLNDLFATIAEILGKPPASERCMEDSFSQLSAMCGEETIARPPFFPNDHSQAVPRGSKRDKRERAWVAVRSNNAPIPGQWKLFLDHSYAFESKIVPKELYDLAVDPKEQRNRLRDSAAAPALRFLVEQASLAAGDDGRSRSKDKDSN